MAVQNNAPVKQKKTVPKKQVKNTPAKPAPVAKVADKTRTKSLEKLKETLLERRNSLWRYFSDTDQGASDKDVQVGDVVDAATESAENELEYHFFEAESREFGQIERAIKRFEEGTYGICETCNCPIPIARLKVLPFAGKCVKCQQIDDNEHNHSSLRGWRSYDYAVSSSSAPLRHADKDYESLD